MTKSRCCDIRSIEAGHRQAWCGLWAGYLDFYEVELPQEITDATWRRLLDPAAPLDGVVAIIDEVPVGFAIYVLHAGTWSIRETCHLEDLFVRQESRGQGVGRALLDTLLRRGEASGWNSVYWHTRLDNHRARTLYDRYASVDDFVRYKVRLEHVGVTGDPGEGSAEIEQP